MKKFWGIIFIITVLFSCKEDTTISNELAKIEIKVVETVKKPITRFGFNLDNFTVQNDTVRSGDSFGELMMQHKVDYPKIAKISQDFKDTFDVRRIRVGSLIPF